MHPVCLPWWVGLVPYPHVDMPFNNGLFLEATVILEIFAVEGNCKSLTRENELQWTFKAFSIPCVARLLNAVPLNFLRGVPRQPHINNTFYVPEFPDNVVRPSKPTLGKFFLKLIVSSAGLWVWIMAEDTQGLGLNFSFFLNGTRKIQSLTPNLSFDGSFKKLA